MTKHKILTYYCPKNAGKRRKKPQLINVQTRNFNRHIMTAKTQNTYIITAQKCRKTPRKPQENPKKTPRKPQENAKKTPRKRQLICTQKRYFNSSKK